MSNENDPIPAGYGPFCTNDQASGNASSQRCQDRIKTSITSAYESAYTSLRTQAIEQLVESVTHYFDGCGLFHQAGLCPIRYNDHVNLELERLTRQAKITARSVLYNYENLGCVCNDATLPSLPQTEEDTKCQCEVPVYDTNSEDKNACEDSSSDSTLDAISSDTSCDDVYSGGSVGTDTPEYNWGYISRPDYEDYLDDTLSADTCDQAIQGISVSLVTSCETNDTRADNETPSDPKPPKYKEGEMVDGQCECASIDNPTKEDEDDTPLSGVVQLPSWNDADVGDGASDVVSGESYIDLLKSETVSQYGYPLEHIFGRHFTYGNIFWVQQLTTYLEEVTQESTNISTYGQSFTDVSSDISITTESVLRRKMKFAVGLCAVGAANVSRVWLEDVLIHDTTDPFNTVDDGIDIYMGGETAKINKEIAEAVGFGRAPAHRDMVWSMVDGDNIVHTVPQVLSEVRSDQKPIVTQDVATTSQTYLQEMTTEHFSTDTLEHKIRISLSGNRLLILDASSFAVLDIIQFSQDVDLASLSIGARTGDFLVQTEPTNTSKPEGDRYEAFARRDGSTHFEPRDTHISYGYSGEYELYTQTKGSLFSPFSITRRWPMANYSVNDKNFIATRKMNKIASYDDLFCWWATNSLSIRNDGHPMNIVNWGDADNLCPVKAISVLFVGKGESVTSGIFFVTGNHNVSSATEYPVAFHYYPNVIGDTDIALSYSPSQVIGTYITSDEISVWADDVVVRGTVLYDEDLIVFLTYDTCSRAAVFRWNPVSGVIWSRELFDIPPIMEVGAEANSNIFNFLSDADVPALMEVNLDNGDVKQRVTNEEPLPYKPSHVPQQIYDNASGAITYLANNGAVVNIFPNGVLDQAISLKDIYKQIETTLRNRGIPVEFNAEAVNTISVEGFRTGSLLSFSDALRNIATTYDVVYFEDNGITAAPRSAAVFANIEEVSSWKTELLDQTATDIFNRIDVTYYDALKLGAESLVSVVASDADDNEYSYGFTSGALITSEFAYQLADLLLANKGDTTPLHVSATLGQRALLLTPGDYLFSDYQIERIGGTITHRDVKSGERIVSTIPAPDVPQLISSQQRNFAKRRPLAKPMIIRAPLVAPRVSGFNSGRLGKQVGLAWVDSRSPVNVLEEDGVELTHELIWGRAASVLPPITNVFTTDYDNSIRIVFNKDTLSFDNASINELLESQSRNVLVCGLETIQFMVAEQDPVDLHIWTFSGLLRGRFGTDTAIYDHITNEPCFFHDTTTIRHTSYSITGNSLDGSFVNDMPRFFPFIPTGFGRLEAACVQDDRTIRNVGSTLWGDDVGREYAPVNVRRIDDPNFDAHHILWDYRDSAGVWFRDTLRPYPRIPRFDIFHVAFKETNPESNGGLFGFDHQISRDYESRSGQHDSNVLNTVHLNWFESDGLYGLRRPQARITKEAVIVHSVEAARERHKLYVYVYNRNYNNVWGSLPAVVSWDIRGWGLYDELYNGKQYPTS